MKHNDVSWGVWCLEIKFFIIHSSYIYIYIYNSYIFYPQHHVTWKFQAMSPAAFPTQLAFSPWRPGATTMPGTVPIVATAMPVSPQAAVAPVSPQAAVAPSTPVKSNAVSQERISQPSDIQRHELWWWNGEALSTQMLAQKTSGVPARRFWLETIRESLEAVTSSTTVPYNCVRCIKSILKQSQGLPVIPLFGLHLSILNCCRSWMTTVWIDRWFMVTVNPLTHLNHTSLLNLDGSW